MEKIKKVSNVVLRKEIPILIRIKEYFISLIDSIFRSLIFLIPLFILCWTFDLWKIFAITLLIPLFGAAMSHIIRKLLFPYIDLKRLLDELYTDNNIGTGIVIAALIIFMSVLMVIFGIALK